MKTIKCPSCFKWYEVEPHISHYEYECTFCGEFYSKKTPKEIDRIKEMKSPVSKPPFQWKKYGEIHWALLIPNNIAFIIQTIIFIILTIIGILVLPL